MFSTLKVTLLGAAALATAAPLTISFPVLRYNTTQEIREILDHFEGGIAPVFMAQVEDPVTEWDRCNIDPCSFIFTPNCTAKLPDAFKPDGCKLAELIEPVIAATVPHAGPNRTALAPRGDDEYSCSPGVKVPSPPRSTALERRQREACPGKCAPWAAIFPFGLWFGVCVADCNIRCNQKGTHCP